MSRSDVGPAQSAYDVAATGVTGRRIAAGLVDIVLMFCLFVLMGLTVGETTVVDGYVSVVLEGGAFISYLGLVFLYFFAFEAASGQTLGKRLLKLRVVGLDGMPARPGAIATRTLLRIVDWLPAFYLVGFVCSLATSHHQRVGDLLAKTIVVRR